MEEQNSPPRGSHPSRRNRYGTRRGNGRQTGSPSCGPAGTNHFHGRLPLENGATGYAVTWKKGSTWRGHKIHTGWGQETTQSARQLQGPYGKRHPETTRNSHHLHGRASRYLEDDLRRPGAGPKVRDQRQKAHCNTPPPPPAETGGVVERHVLTGLGCIPWIGSVAIIYHYRST